MFQPPAFHPERPGLVAPVRVDPRGLDGPTPGQVRGKAWRQTSYGLHVPSSVDRTDPGQRTVEAAALLGPDEGVTGWAALAWQRARWFSGTTVSGEPQPMTIVAKRHVVPPAHIDLSQEYLKPGDVEVVDGLPVTLAVRSVCFEARYAATLAEAVVAVDMGAYDDLVSLSELVPYVAAQMAPTGIGLARKALSLVDENSWSPQETRMRLVWELLGERPRPLCNVPIFDRWGRHVATPDLLDPEAGVVGEYDGSLHLAGQQRARDLRREGELRALGLEYVTMVAGDRTDDHHSFLIRLATAYARAAYSAETDRLWTIQPPSWWTPTTTVQARRALDPALRERLLRHRRAT
ncbi:MAG: hypothetical protein WKF50_13815 [Nocardioides sp.]